MLKKRAPKRANQALSSGVFEILGSGLIIENIRIVSMNLDENRLLHQFYWDLSNFLVLLARRN